MFRIPFDQSELSISKILPTLAESPTGSRSLSKQTLDFVEIGVTSHADTEIKSGNDKGTSTLDDVECNIRQALGEGCGDSEGGRGCGGCGRAGCRRGRRRPRHDRRRCDQGRAVQNDPMKPILTAPGSKRLKLDSDKLLSNFGFNFNCAASPRPPPLPRRRLPR